MTPLVSSAISSHVRLSNSCLIWLTKTFVSCGKTQTIATRPEARFVRSKQGSALLV